jgi:hypothetical protein
MTQSSDEAEAEAVAEAHAQRVAARGFAELRPRAGYVKAKVLGLHLIGGGDSGEMDELVTDSGALYHVNTSFHWAGDDAVKIEISVQEDSGPGPIHPAQWTLSRDGTLTRDY